MSQSLYYSPRLDEKLISPLYHAAKAQRIPMTRLASSLVRDTTFHKQADKVLEKR